MSEAFADLCYERSTGILKGRGGEIALPATKARLFDTLWRARRTGGFIEVGEGHPPKTVISSINHLRHDIKRFGLAIEGKARVGRRLVDLQGRTEETAS